jgi:hypothetical protein
MPNKNKLYSMLQAGFDKEQEVRAAEPNKGGDFRGGNSGCLTSDGVFLGYSPRKTVLRHLGVEKPVTLDLQLIFDAGLTNEDSWARLLTSAGIKFKQEEECPIAWSLPNGQTITGRPDIVIGSEGHLGFDPQFGIELKLISSNGKAVRHSHFGNANPVPEHLCQAAHYSHQMGLDWVLAYTSRAHYTSFYFGAKQWQFDHRCMLLDPKSPGKVINLAPFISLYDVTWDGDTALLDGKPTLITASGIERYYQYCSDCVRDGVIPECGGTVDIWGTKEKRNTNVLYDDFASVSVEDGYDNWVAGCRALVEEEG